MLKVAIIQKLKSGKYRLYSKKKGPDGNRRNLGTFDSLEGAKKREKEVQFFKHHADDGESNDRATQMLKDLSDIAIYLEDAGFVDEANKVYETMNAIDGSLEQNIVDPYPIPDAQMNTANQGYEGGESPIGGGNYSGLSVGEGMRTEDGKDEQNTVDMVASSNGLMGNTVTDNGAAGQFNVLNDAYFYSNIGNMEGKYGE